MLFRCYRVPCCFVAVSERLKIPKTVDIVHRFLRRLFQTPVTEVLVQVDKTEVPTLIVERLFCHVHDVHCCY